MQRSSQDLRQDIVKRLGFFPPFFNPAMETPSVLGELWREMEVAYLDSPIPMLFKEKLAALLARYCRVPYCLVCHTSSLRPLGMSASAILDLLEMSPLDLQGLLDQIDFGSASRLASWPEKNSLLEKSILFCSIASVLDTNPSSSLEHLRKLLSPELYNSLVLLLTYNQTCLTWAESHPEISYVEDKRAADHLEPLTQEEPGLSDYFSGYSARVDAQIERRSLWMSDENKRFAQEERRLRAVAEDQKNRQARLIELLNEEREKRNHFLATVSHDLRSPLTAAKMAIQRHLRRLPSMASEMSTKLCADAVRHIDRTDRMIQNILDASRLNFGEDLPFKFETFNMGVHLAEILTDLQGAHGKRIQLRLPSAAVLPLCDKEAIYRIITNLVSNAVKYGSERTVIQVELTATQEKFTMSVHNLGSFLSQEEQGAIFLPYQRTQSAVRSKQQGWGLGLALINGMIKQLGGDLEVSSQKSVGTTFLAHLPLDCSLRGSS